MHAERNKTYTTNFKHEQQPKNPKMQQWYYSYLPVNFAGAGKGEWRLQERLLGDLALRSSGSSPSADPFLFCLLGVELVDGNSLILPKQRYVTTITQSCSKILQRKGSLRFQRGIIWNFKFFITLKW